MKKPPYHEIINIKEERKEYARLCNGKSKKFTLYTEWENHITELLSDFSTPQDLYNFKHYCMNANRAQEKAPDMHLAYMKRKDEWAFFRKPSGQKAYHKKCIRCAHQCKQSWRVLWIECPRFSRADCTKAPK